jgi:signal transduction histidine kinase
MPGIFQRRFYATLRAPSADALEILAPHASRILSQWRREARALAVEPDRLLAGTTFNFVQLANELRKSQYPDFKRRLQQFGENLAKQGVKLQNAVAAYNRLFEMPVANLIRSVPQRAALITGLVGLHDIVTLLILTGYTDMWAAGNKTLRERGRAKGETRRYKTSEVTRIYEQERRRLSQDLHDQIGHDLVLIKLHLEMIAMEHDQNQPPNVQPSHCRSDCPGFSGYRCAPPPGL